MLEKIGKLNLSKASQLLDLPSKLIKQNYDIFSNSNGFLGIDLF